MFGLMIGLAAGAVQFLILARFTGIVTGGGFQLEDGVKGALLGLLQFFIPPAVLFAVAMLYREGLPYAGAGFAAALIGGALIKFLPLLYGKGKNGGAGRENADKGRISQEIHDD